MLLKVAIVITAVVALFVMVRGARGGGGRDPDTGADRGEAGKTLSSTQCKVCGIYLPAGQTCDCADRT